MNLPVDFIEQTRSALGNEWESFKKSLSSKPPTSIRFNNKLSVDITAEQVAWCESGYYLTQRPIFTFDPLFHAGVYYVQESSSMFLEQVIKQYVKEPIIALDLCAAPGGKSTHLSQILPKNSLLLSNEIVRQRAFILSENIQKWGNTHNIVTNNSPQDFKQINGFFDLILIDAPCSGEGMFRKDPASINEWSIENVEYCAKRQREIIQHVWGCLKENGLLIYSTCTYNSKENEENIEWLIHEFDAEIVRLKIDNQWGITENECGYHFFPHRTKGEGFFLSLIRKKEPTEQLKIKSEKIKKNNYIFNELNNKHEFTPIFKDNQIWAIENQFLPIVQLLDKRLDILHAGVVMCTKKGSDLIPQTGLSLSKAFNTNSVTTYNIDHKKAIAFLQKETIILDNCPRGFVAICYQNIPLGWVKNLGNRSNNLYPTNWRIRSKNNIEEVPCNFFK